MTYIIFIDSVEFSRTSCPNHAASFAMTCAKAVGADAVTCESHSVWGQYAEPELVGKPFVKLYDWQRAVKELMA